jgi:hypothetical protein
MSNDSDIVESGDSSLTEVEPPRRGAPRLPALTRGMVLAGRYEIRKLIGRGGMGVVVRAHDRVLHEDVAIKIVRADLGGDSFWADRLAREVKLARQIHHPNVCRVFDFESAEGRVFLVMELATNRTLRSEIAAGVVAPRPLADRLADARAVASGLGAIHAAGIVHRDLSAQNLLRMADGRLVLSDFGLATSAFENTSGLQGGTVAYMAPELSRGGRASSRSDVWALGVVIHEAVFGQRPSWRTGSFEISDPPLGRRLAPEERAVLDVCRACTAADPDHRPANGAEVAAQLGARRRPRRLGALLRDGRRARVAGVVLAIAATAVLARRISPPGPEAPSAAARPLPDAAKIAPVGEAQDWSDVAVPLADVEPALACATVLPDRRTLRFVWGQPRRAEDLDIASRRRSPAPLVPISYAEGCPDVSPDGRRIVYPGHNADGRAFAFVSDRPDGSGAVPVVATAEPSQASEPTWLPDGQSFSYDIDLRHMGVYSLVTRRSTVLTEPTTVPHTSASRYVSGDRVFVSVWLDAVSSEVSGYGVPSLREDARFHLDELLVDWRLVGASTAYFTTTNFATPSVVFDLDLASHRARRRGFIPGQFIDRLAPVDGGLALVTSAVTSSVTARFASGRRAAFRRDALVFGGDRCGDELLLAEKAGAGIAIVRADASGAVRAQLTQGPADLQVSCAPDGRRWFYSSFGRNLGLYRCDPPGCTRVFADPAWGSAVSPDGARVAFMTVTVRGPTVRWMASDGGEVHDLADTETICGPSWASPRTLWISRRRGSELVWTEVDAESARPTGRVRPGSTDCSDARNDPETPDAAVSVRVDRRSQIRLVPDARL